MASVHKVSRGKGKSSPFWYASFRDRSGRQYFKSTKAKKKPEALRVALEFERMVQGDNSANHFRKVAEELYARTTGEALPFFSTQGWFSTWLDNVKPSVALRTFEDYRKTTEAFTDHLGAKATGALSNITERDILAYRDKLNREGRSTATNTKSLKVIAMPFRAAKARGYISTNPAEGIRHTTERNLKTREIFTPEQVAAMLAASAGTDWEGMLIAGLTTAMRLGDIADMTWNAVDLKGRTFKTPVAKTGRIQASPLHPDFLKWLKGQPKASGTAPIFPSLHGRAKNGRLSKEFVLRVMTPAGVKGAVLRAAQGKGRTTTSLTFHCLRHTATSLMANSGVSAEQRMRITGHKDSEVHDNYTHFNLESLRGAVESIHLPKKKKTK